MSFYDKSDKVGYDQTDEALNAELVEMLARTPLHIQRNLQHRVHDAILTRMKEECTRKCFSFIRMYEKCVNTVKPHQIHECYPHRDALNDCAHEINREETYQKYRLQYLRGELLRFHEERLGQQVESFKARAPGSIPTWRADYAPKYAEHMANYGSTTTGTEKQEESE